MLKRTCCSFEIFDQIIMASNLNSLSVIQLFHQNLFSALFAITHASLYQYLMPMVRPNIKPGLLLEQSENDLPIFIQTYNLFHWRKISWITHPETSSRGSNSRNDPGVLLVYSNSTCRAEHAHICETSQRVANSGVRVLWSWKFWPKK